MTAPGGDTDTASRGSRILIVDDDKGFRMAAKTLFEDEGFAVHLCSKAGDALKTLAENHFDLLLSDVVMETVGGIELLKEVRAKYPELPVIMITGYGSIPSAVEAMRLGATDYLTKPAKNDELLIKTRRSLELGRKDRELRMLREELRKTYTFGNIVTRSMKMRDLIRQITQVADTDVTILIQGESGVGKELVARALHFTSIRKDHPFVVINCAAIPENLMESELFGHEKGAFTGALKSRIGKFEEANRGTLFLDEIGDLSPAIQVKILRVLQDKQFTRIGSNVTMTADVRIVAATNRNLEVMVHEGDFREDLYYRLNVFSLSIPPLRERVEDILLLADHFLHAHADLSRGETKSLSPEAASEMLRYSWPGNIRELQNTIKRAIIKSPGAAIVSLELPGDQEMKESPPGNNSRLPDVSASYKDYMSAILRDAEEKYLLRALKLHRGNVNRVAKLLGVDRKTVYRKLSEYAIDPGTYRE